MKKLIADSGSTKTDWCLMDREGHVTEATTQGINPFYQQDEEIVSILTGELTEKMGDAVGHIGEVVFYGAGLRPEMQERMRRLLSLAFHPGSVDAMSDLVGAARALLGHRPGIACILGTGSNSGLYDGRQIIQNTPPLGFILGDEGSGAVMGKCFLGALYKGLLPDSLLEEFTHANGLQMADVIDAVYRRPLPNRFLAQTTRFIHDHLDVDEVRSLVVEHFRAFFRRNIVQYQHPDMPVCAVGSVAWYFRDPFSQAAAEEGFKVGRILQRPMPGLVEYHQFPASRV